MAGLNRATICGRLGRDPETRTFQSGGSIVTFSIATSESWMKDGERVEQTEWHNIVVQNEKQGEIAAKYLRKGSEVLIEGTIKTRKWTDKDGATRATTEIVVPKFGGSLTLIGGKANGGGGSRDGDGGGEAAPRQQRQQPATPTIIEDDIPW